MSNMFDVCVIGLGISGAFATLRMAEKYKDAKIIAFDLGRKWAKRRRQCDGFLGCFPNSDGKLYLSDLQKASNLIGSKKTKLADDWVNKIFSNIDEFKVTKDRLPYSATTKKIKQLGYDISLNDYIQLYPKNVHALSKYMADIFEKNKNLTFNFDSEVLSIQKYPDHFTVSAEGQEFTCKKVILAAGRSGWRWAAELYKTLGIVENNDYAKFGIRVELNSTILKDFNKSCCTLSKENLSIGPFQWNGTIIPEDHLDMAISAFRSNEDRWKTDKVFFNIIGNMYHANKGYEQTDRLAKLTFILANDRILKEKVYSILAGKSKISIIPEYGWLKDVIMELSNVIPDIVAKAYFHVPTIVPIAPKINLGSNLESDVEGLFIVGESAGITGILAAAVMGCTVADSVCK